MLCNSQSVSLISFKKIRRVNECLRFATTGKPLHIRLTPDRNQIKADRNGLSFVIVEILDDTNRVIPDATIPIRFSITGNAEIEATGNANPAEMASFKQPRKNTFRGRCLAVVRPKGKAGTLILKAEATGLQHGVITIIVK